MDASKEMFLRMREQDFNELGQPYTFIIYLR